MHFRSLLVGIVAVLISATELKAQPAPLPFPDTPPLASLMTVSTPDVNGRVTVSGSPGAAQANSNLFLVNLNTGHFTKVTAGSSGAFSGSVFAPPGSTLLVRTGSEQSGPGTILYVPARNSSAEGGAVSFSGSGWTREIFQAPNFSPSWTFDGTMNSSQLQPGQELSIRGTLQVVDSQIQAGSRIRVRPYLGIERVTGPDGTAISAFNMLFSTVLTPTGLPMENTFGGSGGETPNSAGVNPQASPSVELQVQAGSATGNIELSLKLPADFLAGYYLPFVSFAFDGVQFGPSVQDRTAVGSHFGRLRNLAGEQNAMYLPVVRLGDPPPTANVLVIACRHP
jgi:hypothetical protein